MSGYYLLKNGEFAYNKSYSVGYDFGSIKRLDRYPMGALSTLYICFTLKRHESDFIKSYFDSLKWYREIYMISAEGARNHGLLNVPTEEFFDTKHYLPENTDEQRKIADFLIALDRRIETQQSLVDNLKKYKRGLLTYAFEEITLSDDADSTTYLFSEIAQRRKEKYNPDCNVEYPCIELEHIEQGTGRLLGSVSSKTQSSIKTVAKSGDVLFGKLRPYLRKFAFAEQDMVCSSEIWAFVPSKYVIPKYLYYLVQTEHFLRVANVSSGTKMPRAEWANIEKEPFDIPYIPIQEKVVSILEAVDKKISVSGDSLRMLLNFRDGLLQQLFI
ncbi:restriction endonuclease subunit S [Phascolarctobacterium faecium]|uniref:restriction endonuclease subunit S n=1 Tax=Phascolarctobacterium faecium TaxID=33025 RepID=UPI00399AA63C